jgi:hypothetical protein
MPERIARDSPEPAARQLGLCDHLRLEEGAPVHKKAEALEVEMGGRLGKTGMETKAEEWGDLTIRHITVPAHNDVTDLLKGLPGDLCQCPHWGLMLAGSIHARYADGSEELTEAGEFYYWPPGHTGWTDEEASFVEFSPTAQLLPVLEHMARKMAK